MRSRDTRHVDVIEEGIKCIGLTNDDDDAESHVESSNENEMKPSLSEKEIEQSYESVKNEELDETKGSSSLNNEKVQRPSRIRVPNSKYFSDEYVNFIYVNYCDATALETVKEAINTHQSENWRKAMKSENESI